MNTRLYQTPADLEAMIRLVLRVRPPGSISDYPSILDLRELLCLPEMQTATRLWETEPGRLTGFALVDSVNNLLFELDPDAATPEMETQVVAWGLSRLSRGTIADKMHPSLDASCSAKNTTRKAFLERNGFRRVPGESVTLTRSLSEPIPLPILPPGFTIRNVAGEQEVKAYVALHRVAFNTLNMTIDYRLAIMRSPDYLPKLDLVAVAPDGALAALCVCQISQSDNVRSGRLEGRTDPVATHPDYRRRGLAKALLLTGLCLLKERGMEIARLSTNGDNAGMIHAANQVGFSISSAIYWYSKPIS
jgi:ribosomal protein S18 acetylase RimI-like enzyme